jgi:putative ABC transport system substrate-binding protein
MKRREFIAGLGGVVAWPFDRPLAAEAQRKVGALSGGTGTLDAFSEGLAKFGWVEGRNLRIDYRLAGRFRERFRIAGGQVAGVAQGGRTSLDQGRRCLSRKSIRQWG